MATMRALRTLGQSDLDRLIDLLADKAIAAPAEVGVKGYFRNLVIGAELPQAFKQQRTSWTGDARVDALELVNWAQNRGTNPANRNWTTLGSLLIRQFADSGLEQASTLAAMIVAYGLCRDQKQLDALASRYQVLGAALPGSDLGPDFDWRGPAEAELQGWFTPEPDLLDVGFLRRGIERATSVCRVEVGSSGASGSGVLIDGDLVLTNFHVLGETAEAVAQAAPSTRLRFGAFTSRGGDEDKGQLVRLDAARPVEVASAIGVHDFVLLRADAAITGLADVAPAPFSLSQPSAKAGINILQHPAGKAMMLAVSGSGVTGAYPSVGYLQYVSKTAPGSSGGPCFDDDWNVVAIHHAVRSKAFGVIGEGILMSSIFEAVKHVLQARPA